MTGEEHRHDSEERESQADEGLESPVEDLEAPAAALADIAGGGVLARTEPRTTPAAVTG